MAYLFLFFLTMMTDTTGYYKFNRLVLLDDGNGGVPYMVPLIEDTNHDGFEELIIPHPQHTIWEYRPVNQYVKVYTRPGDGVLPDTGFFITDVGDADGDGLSDICGDFSVNTTQGFNGIAIFESKDAYSYPDTFVWVGLIDTSVMVMTMVEGFTDLDSDGKMELFIRRGDARDPAPPEILIYENKGNNEYEQVWKCNTGFDAIAFGDFDSDNKMEFFLAKLGSGFSHECYIYECTGDDKYDLVWSDHHNDWIAVFDAWVGNDTDRDGKPEIFINNYWYGPNPSGALMMYEATGDNAYKLVNIDTVGFADLMDGRSCCGDVDGDGVDEVVFSLGYYVCIYKAVGDDKYERVWKWKNDMGSPLTGYTASTVCHDFNKNGYDELIISGSGKTSIFEIDKASIAELKTQPLVKAQLSVVPNPIKNSAIIRYCIPKDCRVEIAVYDATGRVVKKLVNKELKAGAYTIPWREKALPTGIYFIRLKTPASALTEKVIITR